MEVKKIKEGNNLIVNLIGRLDAMTAPQLDQDIDKEIDGLETLTFDLKELEYISSSGLRVLLAAHKKMMKQGEMFLMNLNESVQEIFEITGFADIMNIK